MRVIKITFTLPLRKKSSRWASRCRVRSPDKATARALTPPSLRQALMSYLEGPMIEAVAVAVGDGVTAK